MQNIYTFHQVNNIVVNPVYVVQLGFISDGKILHYENFRFL